MRRTSRRSASPPRIAAAISDLDAILKGHRSGTSGGRATAVAVGRRWARGDQGLEVGLRPAQPTCVRAFFLRFASLRLRFTDGFS